MLEVQSAVGVGALHRVQAADALRAAPAEISGFEEFSDTVIGARPR